ncbi:hypothetical protein ACQEUU_04675 [Nonomuraea sp. CA-218870]|uniref:hypothetical protein n=1 Tax=Nonomuraea sp. CA-218870 TaxID=3239998 RepID=UPI003D917189
MEEHRIMLVADVEDYSSRNGHDQAKLQAALVGALDHAGRAAKLGILGWDRQKQGDGQFVVLPPRTDPVSVLSPFVKALSKYLRHKQTATFRIRVRLAIHEGPIQLDGANGYPGDHAVQPNRMVGAQPLRAALAACPEAYLGVIVSERIFTDYIGQRPGSPRRDRFRRVDVEEKKNRYVGYIHVPGHNVHAVDISSTIPPGPDIERTLPVLNISGAGANVAMYGDQTNHQTFGR